MVLSSSVMAMEKENNNNTSLFSMDVASGSASGTQYQATYYLNKNNGVNLNFYIENTGSVDVKISINGKDTKTLAPGDKGDITTSVTGNNQKFELKAVPTPNGGDINIEYAITQMNESQIQTRNIEYEAQNEDVQGVTFVNETIALTREYKYGKAFYSNNGSKDVTLIVTGTTISQTIPAGSGIGVLWQNSSILNKTYTVSVSGDGSENLSGTISVAKSNVKDKVNHPLPKGRGL